MLLVGLTGGVATGKSTVAKQFRDCGAVVIDADTLARDVVAPGKPAWRDIVRRFGKGVLLSDRTVDRAALARSVFRNHRSRKLLNHIVHPRVGRAQRSLTRQAYLADRDAVVIYDAPVLIEAGAHSRMERLIVVTADQNTQVARLKRRNHLTRAEALRRIRSQLPLATKRKLADYVVDGTVPPKTLAARVKDIFRELDRLSRPPKRST